MSTIKVDTIATRTGSGNITLSNSLASATVAGDLTVDTNTLKVNASTNRVGIGTVSPPQKFVVSNAGADNIVMTENSSASIQMFMQAQSGVGAVGTLTNHDTVFLSNNSEKGRFLAGGGLTFNGDTAAANALDDYEEGTWTPIIHSAGGTPTTYSFGVNGNYGYYTKVGNIVTAHAHCVFQRGTATGAIDLGGLPFTSANVTTGYASTTTSYWSLATAIVKVEMHLNPNSTRGSNTTRIATGATTSMNTSLQSGNLNTGSNTILYSITYRSA